MGKTIGLVGGLGPHATIYYYRRLVELSANEPSALKLLISHADVGFVLSAAARGDRAAMAKHLIGHLEALGSGGADLFAIAALTAHACANELRAGSRLEIIDPIDVLNAHLAVRGVKRVVLLGTAASMESRLFGRLVAEAALPPDPILRQLHELYVGIVATGRGSDDGCRNLVALAREWSRRLEVDAIVLAGTELALIDPAWWGDETVISSADLHLAGILQAAGR